MTEHLLSPDRSIEIASTTYKLSGGLPALKAIQEKFERDILLVVADVMQFKLWFTDLAIVIRLGIVAAGETPPELEVIEAAVVEDIGINQTSHLVMEWLVAATSPKKERVGNVQGVQAAIRALEAARLKAPRKK